MLEITSISNGIVIDHIKAEKGILIYKYLKLDRLDNTIALILNANSSKYGKKDIIKIENEVDMDLSVLGFFGEHITVNIIKNGVIVEKINISLPEYISGVLECKNPRCITSVENGIVHKFRLADKNVENGTDKVDVKYRCCYCDHMHHSYNN